MSRDEDSFSTQLRDAMVREQLERRDIRDERVLAACRKVPRHVFVPPGFKNKAYEDTPLPLGPEETISQPYIVAYMLQKLELCEKDRVLDVGSGSGYQSALLAELCREVFSIEIDPLLTARSAETLKALGYRNIRLRTGDGHLGWPEEAPFDKIIVSASCGTVPRELVAQLADNGKMILPVGESSQYLVLLNRHGIEVSTVECCAVSFVRMRDRLEPDAE